MKAKGVLTGLALAMCISLTGCDDDSISYFFSSDSGFFFFSFGDTVDMKPTTPADGGSSQSPGQGGTSNAQPATVTVPASTTNLFERMLYSFERLALPTPLDSAETAPEQAAPAAAENVSEP